MELKNRVNAEIGITDSLSYITEGLAIALSKKCRMFVILPVIINFFVLLAGGYLFHRFVMSFLSEYTAMLPSWLSFLSTVISALVLLSFGFVFCYFFAAIATFIASPFYGVLSQRAEKIYMKVESADSDEGLLDVVKDIPRILSRELRKLVFLLPRLILCLIISVIPVLNIIAPLCWFLLASWMMSIQYTDYAYDNKKIPFQVMRQELSEHRFAVFIFGAVTVLAVTVPILNLVIPPAAVCAGTVLYLEIQSRKIYGFSVKERRSEGESVPSVSVTNAVQPFSGSSVDRRK